jgi:hypothetical protein
MSAKYQFSQPQGFGFIPAQMTVCCAKLSAPALRSNG